MTNFKAHLVALGLLVLGSIAVGQELRVQIQRPGSLADPSIHFGSAITTIADANGDGLRDFLIGDDLGVEYFGATGLVIMHSRTGAQLSDLSQTLLGTVNVDPSQRLGAAICDLGVDSAGIIRFAAGAPSHDGAGVNAGRVIIGYPGFLLTPPIFLNGLSAGEEFGSTLAAIGDLTGDGLSEFLAAAPKANVGGANAGRVSLHNGASGVVIYSVNGAPGSLFGSSLAAGRDVDQDGSPDFVVGAPNHSTIGTNRGRAYVMSGLTGAVIMTLDGNSNGDNFGRAVTLMRDLDGDGRAEIGVSAPGDDVGMTNNGAVTIHRGSNGSILRTLIGEKSTDLWGQALAAGDADRDGIDDILVGSPFADRGVANNGAAVLYSGADGSVLWRDIGRRPGGEYGHAVAFLGDHAGSGIEEFAVTEWKIDRSVSIYSFVPPVFPRISSIAKAEVVAVVGDVDGDGKKDFAYREPPPTLIEKPESVAVASSATNDVLVRLYSPSFNVGSSTLVFGTEICSVGDFDGDGVDDIGVGEWATSGLPSQGGSIYVYSGATGSLALSVSIPLLGFGSICRGIGDTDGNGLLEIAVGGDRLLRCYEIPTGTLRWTTTVTGQVNMARELDVIGDVNGDGADDVIVGTSIDIPTGSTATTAVGTAYVISGFDGSVIYSYVGAPPIFGVGRSVAGLGDQNGDGVNDFAITAFVNGLESTSVCSGQTGSPIFNLWVGGRPHLIGDITGDGIDEVVVVGSSAVHIVEGGTGLLLVNTLPAAPNSVGSTRLGTAVLDDVNGDLLPDRLVCSNKYLGHWDMGGAFKRGVGIKGTQRLSLDWNALAGSTTTDGTMNLTGGAANSTALMMLSLNGATLAFEPYVALIDVFDPSFSIFPIALDTSGAWSMSTDLFDPTLQNFVLHLQAIDTTPTLDGTYSMSNALVMRFMP